MRLYGTDGTTLATLAGRHRRVTDGAASFTLRNSDFNVQSFRSNLVLRWEWRAGSTLYLVWQQDSESELIAPQSRLGRRHVQLAWPPRRQFLRRSRSWYWFSPN